MGVEHKLHLETLTVFTFIIADSFAIGMITTKLSSNSWQRFVFYVYKKKYSLYTIRLYLIDVKI